MAACDRPPGASGYGELRPETDIPGDLAALPLCRSGPSPPCNRISACGHFRPFTGTCM